MTALSRPSAILVKRSRAAGFGKTQAEAVFRRFRTPPRHRISQPNSIVPGSAVSSTRNLPNCVPSSRRRLPRSAPSEVESRLREQFERMLGGMDLVTRDEFEAVKAMAAKARSEQEDLAKRVAELEGLVAAMRGAKATPGDPASDPTLFEPPISDTPP